MKLLTTPALLGALCLSVITAHAATPPPTKPPAKTAYDKTAPPQDAFGVFSFEKAKAEADKKKRALVFLVSDERADDAAVKKATNKSYWTFAEDCVVVLLRASTAGEWTRLPDKVQKAIKSKDLGAGFPKIVGFDEAADTPLLGMQSGQIVQSDDKALDRISRELKNANKSKTPVAAFPPPSLADATPPAAPAKPAATPPPTTPPTATPPAKPGETPPAAVPPAPAPVPAVPAVILIKGGQPENWTNAEGRAIQATLAEVAADKVVFVMPNGARIDYDLAKLSDASKKRVEALKAASTPH